MRAGFYTRLEGLQGVRHTYHASEVLSFSCVEPVVAYAVDLVRRHFAGDLAFARGNSWQSPGVRRPFMSRLRSRLMA